MKICGVPSCTASIARAFSLPSFLTLPSTLFPPRLSRTLYISLSRSLRDEAFVARSRCDAVRRCAVRALREKAPSARAHICIHRGGMSAERVSRSPVGAAARWRPRVRSGDGENAAYPSVLSRFGRFVGPAIYGRIRSGSLYCCLLRVGPARALFHQLPRFNSPFSPPITRYQAEMAIYFTGLALRRRVKGN